MNAHILREINDANSKFSAYYSLLDLRYKNLCAKADGASLMPVTVIADGYECNIEEVAMVAKPNRNPLPVRYRIPSLRASVSGESPGFRSPPR